MQIYLSQALLFDLLRTTEAKFDTISKFCIYDEPHNDYLYTDAWVTFIAGLFEKHGFTKENIRTNCVQGVKGH